MKNEGPPRFRPDSDDVDHSRWVGRRAGSLTARARALADLRNARGPLHRPHHTILKEQSK